MSGITFKCDSCGKPVTVMAGSPPFGLCNACGWAKWRKEHPKTEANPEATK